MPENGLATDVKCKLGGSGGPVQSRVVVRAGHDLKDPT